MFAKAIPGAAMLCVLCAIWQPASAQPHQKVAQNVQYVICMTTGSAGRCTVQEPIDPCPSPSAEAFPKRKFATVRDACSEAKKRQECRGGLSGC
jgi:hypothetical protein